MGGLRLLALLVVLGAAVACSVDDEDVSPGQPVLQGRLVVFAASSLTESFKAIGAAFEAAHPDVTVEFNVASSSALATQIEEAAPADVFASADSAQMRRLDDGGWIEGAPRPFASNSPVLVVPSSNRAAIRTPADLARPGVKLVLAARDVPIGAYARQIIARLEGEPGYPVGYEEATLRNVVSNEANVRAVLAKVELGEADAAIVYRTDAIMARDRVQVIELPASANVVATYPIGAVRDGRTALARAFIEYVSGVNGQALLRAAGFEASAQ